MSIRNHHPRGGHLRIPGCTIVLTLLAAGVSFHPSLPGVLQYNGGLLHHASWELLTWQWVHWSPSHALWDIGAFAVLGTACELRSRPRFLACLGLATVTGALSLLWMPHGNLACRGLSGIDSALFALAATDSARAAWQRRDRVSLLLGSGALLAFGAKTAVELGTGQAIFADGGGMVVLTATHAAGAAAGGMAAFFPSAQLLATLREAFAHRSCILGVDNTFSSGTTTVLRPSVARPGPSRERPRPWKSTSTLSLPGLMSFAEPRLNTRPGNASVGRAIRMTGVTSRWTNRSPSIPGPTTPRSG